MSESITESKPWSLAGFLYERYCAAVGGKAFNGDPLPSWEEFSSDPAKQVQADAWRSLEQHVMFSPAEGREPVSQIQPHQQRVVDEKADLDTKVLALEKFIAGSPIFAGLTDAEKERLVRQASCMSEYSGILGERIEAF